MSGLMKYSMLNDDWARSHGSKRGASVPRRMAA